MSNSKHHKKTFKSVCRYQNYSVLKTWRKRTNSRVYEAKRRGIIHKPFTKHIHSLKTTFRSLRAMAEEQYTDKWYNHLDRWISTFLKKIQCTTFTN